MRIRVKKKIAILISGRGSNMEAIAKNCQNGILQNLCEVAVVIANNPGAKGFFTAKQLGIPIGCIPSKNKNREDFERELIKMLNPYAVDYIVLAGFMRLLSPLFIKAYSKRIINIHPADTKQFQGVGGYEWAYENTLSKTTITVHFVDEGIDTGQVIAKKEIDLKGFNTLEEIEKKGLEVEQQFYSQVLKDIFNESTLLQKALKRATCKMSWSGFSKRFFRLAKGGVRSQPRVACKNEPEARRKKG